MSWAMALFLGAGMLAADPLAAMTDSAKIQGTWVLASTETDGQATPAESLKARPVRIIFEGDQIAAKEGDKAVSLGSFTLDQAKDPKSYDRTYPDGSPRRGIYKLEDDTLTVCIAPLGKERPKSFATKAGDGLSLVVYKREKP